MLITRVHLKNIRTHKNSTVHFQEGINVLAGLNGSGKSTVLDMIGYALFNYLPGNQQPYVRTANTDEKIRYGSVSVDFIGKDGDEYRVFRTIGKSGNTLKISHLNPKIDLADISTINQYVEWIQDQFGLAPSMDLENIFKNSIGVKQGTFTAPFLGTDANRRTTFNPLLNIDVYETVWKRYLKIISIFKERINALQNTISKLEGRLEHTDELEKELDKIHKDSSTAINNRAQVVKELEVVEKEYLQLKSQKEKLDELVIQKDKADLSIQALSRELESITKNIEEARTAESICSTTKNAYLAYRQKKEEEQQLNQLFIQLQDFEKKNQNIQKQLQRKEQSSQDLKEQQDAILGLQPEFSQLKSVADQMKENIEKREKIMTLLSQIKIWKQNVNTAQKESEATELKLTQIKKKLEQWDELESRVKQFSKLEDMKVKLTSDITSLSTKIAEQEQNKTLSKDGKCPFLEEKCKNIEGDSLSDFFQQQIESLTRELGKKKTQEDLIHRKYEDAKSAQDQLQLLKGEKTLLMEYETQIANHNSTIQELSGKIHQESQFSKQLEQLDHLIAELNPKVQRFNVISEKITKDLPLIKKKMADVQQQITIFRENIAPLTAKLEELQDVPTKILTVRTRLEELFPQYEKYQENIRLAQKLPALLDKSNEKTKEYSTQTNSQKGLSLQIDALQKDFSLAKYQRLESQKDNLSKQRIMLNTQITSLEQQKASYTEKIEKMSEFRKELEDSYKILADHEELLQFAETMRTWYKESQPKIVQALLNRINYMASDIFRDLFGETAVQLVWLENFNIEVRTAQNTREFAQLSGGEQMSAALAIRLAILKVLTNLDLAFFDEPTINLDTEKRINLAKTIQKIRGFRQIFVISHDDTFEETADYVIHFQKNEEEETLVEYTQ